MLDRMMSLESATWIHVLGTLLLFLLMLVGIVYGETLEAWYLREAVAPGLEREFGFSTVSVREKDCECSSLVVSSITAGGIFDQAGVRIGDRPWDYHGREEITFYTRLPRAREEKVSLPFVRPSNGPSGSVIHIEVTPQKAKMAPQ